MKHLLLLLIVGLGYWVMAYLMGDRPGEPGLKPVNQAANHLPKGA